MQGLNVLKRLPPMSKEKRSGLVGALVTPSLKAEVVRIAEQDDRSLSFVAGALLERGLELYRRDGLLRSKGKDGLGVIRARVEEAPRKKNKL